jgi:hypothetical protein
MNANKIIIPRISYFLSYFSVIRLRAAMQMYKGRMWPAGRIANIADLIREDLFRDTKIIGGFFSY